jgi:hypothetical protein
LRRFFCGWGRWWRDGRILIGGCWISWLFYFDDRRGRRVLDIGHGVMAGRTVEKRGPAELDVPMRRKEIGRVICGGKDETRRHNER